MYLKSLTLRGFKSFASATTLRLEPGITCVVGPNGSGKSNIVDALSWVMGEQGAKSLRGGKMEDVVFAGTTSRPPLGRAEVTLTIDNSDGALPIDYAEVTISRLMFRSGQSEYAINGDQCRLLDVAELLSDSGLGREMHVIIGQGQLDEILHAGPEARRALIEEAAGVLKHRRRKEKALRKLEAMQANLTRLVDLTAELSRRLKPLGRQAEMAKKAAAIQAELRDARLRLARRRLRDAGRRAAPRRGRRGGCGGPARRPGAGAGRRPAPGGGAGPGRAAGLGRPVPRPGDLVRAVLTDRTAARDAAPGRPAAHPADRAGRARAPRPRPRRAGPPSRRAARGGAELTVRLAAGREVARVAAAQRAAAEAELTAAERRIAEGAKAAAARAGELPGCASRSARPPARAAAAQDELDRLAAAAEQATERAALAQQAYDQSHDLAGGGDDDRSELVAAHEQAARALAEYAERTVAARTAERESARELAGLKARAETLAEAARRGADASAALLADPVRFTGVLGPFAERLHVAEGFEVAIAAALGAAADAVAVDGLDAAAEILAALRRHDAGSARLVIAAPCSRRPGSPAAAGSAAAPVPPPSPSTSPLSSQQSPQPHRPPRYLHPRMAPRPRSVRSTWCGRPMSWRM